MTNATHVPEGWPTLIPRIVSSEPEQLVDFVKEVFGATGEFHANRPTELRFDGSILMISGSTERDLVSAFLYVYVANTDATYERALELGAASIEEPRVLPYGDRRAMVLDPWGNTWQIATHSGSFTP